MLFALVHKPASKTMSLWFGATGKLLTPQVSVQWKLRILYVSFLWFHLPLHETEDGGWREISNYFINKVQIQNILTPMTSDDMFCIISRRKMNHPTESTIWNFLYSLISAYTKRQVTNQSLQGLNSHLVASPFPFHNTYGRPLIPEARLVNEQTHEIKTPHIQFH